MIFLYWSKFKIVVNFIYGYQNLSEEKYKTNKKTRAQSGLPVKKKSKIPPKNTVLKKVTFWVVFGFSPKW